MKICQVGLVALMLLGCAAQKEDAYRPPDVVTEGQEVIISIRQYRGHRLIGMSKMTGIAGQQQNLVIPDIRKGDMICFRATLDGQETTDTEYADCVSFDGIPDQEEFYLQIKGADVLHGWQSVPQTAVVP